MAIGLVKWWRARFLAGYKPFSVVAGGAEGSDSEELLASVATPCNSSPPPPSPLLSKPESPPVTVNIPVSPTSPTNDENTNSNPTRQLSFEEFECDVSVAEGDRRRQEFSFTLYDFDGHGKITKDDIAGLVTTIYDTLGASIQVPPCGSKTIKVKLTVSPDQRTGLAQSPRNNGATQQQPPTQNPSTQDTSCCHVKHTNPSCAHGNATRRVPRRRRAPRQRCRVERGGESHSDEDAENVPANHCKQEEIRKRVGPVPHLPSPCYNSSEGDVSDDSDVTISPSLSPLTPLVTNHRKRNGDMQRQQLLEIIQANMEKNNLSFHATRKRPQPDVRIPYRSPPDEPSSPCMPRTKQQSTPTAARHISATYHKPVRESNNQQTPKFTSKTRGVNVRKHRGVNHQQPNVTTTKQPTAVNHHTRTHVQTQILTQNATSPTTNVLNNRQIIDQGVTYANNYLNKCNDAPNVQQPIIGKPSKKHLLKHATREQDQARAMAQVVRWLEREFSQNSSNTNTPTSRRHVHEHIHHHYHHYHAEALV